MVKSTGICTGKLSKDGYTFHTMGRQKDYSWSNVEKADWSAEGFFTQFSLCVVFKISMYIIWGSEAFWTGAQVQATQGKCAQLREKRRTLTDTYACITQSVKYNNLYACHARKLFFIDIFFHHLHFDGFSIFRYTTFLWDHFWVGSCYFRQDTLYIRTPRVKCLNVSLPTLLFTSLSASINV